MQNKAWIKAGLLAAGVSILLQLLGTISCLKCALWPIYCTSWFLVPLTCGFLASTWATLARDDLREAAIQGALAGLVLGVLSGIVSISITIISSVLNLSTVTFFNAIEENRNLTDYLPINTLNFGTRIVFSTIGFVFGTFSNVILSVIGGIIKVALSKK
ncbi:hypothetical protein JW766_02465 [Candidatus Dojkabacteria bacterium]|nr:hypothetical protein [Candidatus Dojkabacteria bacterium]